MRDRLPEPLLRYGPHNLMWWQWLALPLLALIALACGRVLGSITCAVLARASAQTTNTRDDHLLRRVRPSITLLWSLAVAAALLPWLALLPASRGFVRAVMSSLALFAIFWGLWRSVDVVIQALLERPSNAANASVRSLLSVGGNLLKLLVVVAGLAVMLEAWGYQVATVMAGLGLGGIALAFGAQKTVENLFGSVALAADQPLRVGDYVRVEDVTGTVESIGTRSTRLRTLDRTQVTIPNGKLADTRIESFGARDRIRLAMTVGVTYGTSRDQMTRILAGIERVLRSQPLIWPDTVVARFAALGPHSLEIEVMCWFNTEERDQFRACRQDVLLGIMEVVEGAGSSFAFPTRTVHLVGGSEVEGECGGRRRPVTAQPSAWASSSMVSRSFF